MTLFRPHKGKSAAETAAVHAESIRNARPRQRWVIGSVAAFGMLALLGAASTASALILTGGPVDVLPGGGSCLVSGVASQNGGATVSCTGLVLGDHTNVYFGIKNLTNVNGNTMTGSNPAASSASVFRYAGNTATSITYTSTTTVTDALNGAQSVDNRLVLTLTSGSATIVPTGGNPVSNGNGDIERVFRIDTGTSFAIRVDVDAKNGIFTSFDNACPTVFDPTHETPALPGGDRSKVDVAFYFSDCGDSVKDSPEECDLGTGVNGDPSNCCNSDCTWRDMGEVCRVGGGAPCDVNETCTGVNEACPPDDAPGNQDNVCRSGSGDICDQNETCTGVPGQGCPADDAAGNAGIVCRASTVGDICDEDEVCTGVPLQTCPADDVPSKLNVVCRNGSGDICDPDELCTGIKGQGCPADQVANPTTVCRAGSGDSCDPSELCTAVPGAPCPPDVVQPNGTECRASAGTCDVAENCSGTPGQPCPADGFESAGTSCNDDTDVCTVDECDGSGGCLFVENLDCDDTNSCTQDSCDPINGCEYDGSPATTCVAATKAVFKYKNNDTNSRDKLVFVWKGGPFLVEDMGDPVTGSTRYELCVYDQNGVQLAVGVPGGASWDLVGSVSSPKGYKYKNSTAPLGIKLIKTKGSNLDRAKAKVVGKGVGLPDTAPAEFLLPITAQLYASDGGCWEAEFDTPQTRKNEDGKYIGKLP